MSWAFGKGPPPPGVRMQAPSTGQGPPPFPMAPQAFTVRLPAARLPRPSSQSVFAHGRRPVGIVHCSRSSAHRSGARARRSWAPHPAMPVAAEGTEAAVAGVAAVAVAETGMGRRRAPACRGDGGVAAAGKGRSRPMGRLAVPAQSADRATSEAGEAVASSGTSRRQCALTPGRCCSAHRQTTVHYLV